MTNQEELKKFFNHTMANAIMDYEDTKEYKYFKQRKDHTDEILDTNLPEDDKNMVNEILFELGVATDHEKGLLYRQGLKRLCLDFKKSGGIA